MFNVLEFKGSGIASAHTVIFYQFDTYDDAHNYIIENEELYSKYWTKLMIVSEGDNNIIPAGGDGG